MDGLSRDLLGLILSRMEPLEAVRLARVSKRFSAALESGSFLSSLLLSYGLPPTLLWRRSPRHLVFWMEKGPLDLENIVRGGYEYKGALEDDELSFQEADFIRVIKKDASGWWQGVHVTTNEIGWFPSNFVQEVARLPPELIPYRTLRLLFSLPHNSPKKLELLNELNVLSEAEYWARFDAQQKSMQCSPPKPSSFSGSSPN